jgi:uncharacterized membrane protein YphA (DoxX/SURF4 family)
MLRTAQRDQVAVDVVREEERLQLGRRRLLGDTPALTLRVAVEARDLGVGCSGIHGAAGGGASVPVALVRGHPRCRSPRWVGAVVVLPHARIRATGGDYSLFDIVRTGGIVVGGMTVGRLGMASGSVWRSAARQLPLRLTVGAFFLHSGLSKRDADQATAERLHQFATTTYPFLGRLDAQKFARLLSAGEIAVAAALLLPVVPAAVAGAALTAFSCGTLGLYLRTPGMRQEGSLRPTEQGIALAKDVWMLGAGISLIAEGMSERRGPATAALGARCRMLRR